MMSTIAMAQIQMRDAIESMRRDLQAQLEQNRAESQQWDQEAQEAVAKIASKLGHLTH